jgi:hypothetical protein
VEGRGHAQHLCNLAPPLSIIRDTVSLELVTNVGRDGSEFTARPDDVEVIEVQYVKGQNTYKDGGPNVSSI